MFFIKMYNGSNIIGRTREGKISDQDDEDDKYYFDDQREHDDRDDHHGLWFWD